MVTIEQEWAITLCPIRYWRLLPNWSAQKQRWPRQYRFHWLFLFVEMTETPV